MPPSDRSLVLPSDERSGDTSIIAPSGKRSEVAPPGGQLQSSRGLAFSSSQHTTSSYEKELGERNTNSVKNDVSTGSPAIQFKNLSLQTYANPVTVGERKDSPLRAFFNSPDVASLENVDRTPVTLKSLQAGGPRSAFSDLLHKESNPFLARSLRGDNSVSLGHQVAASANNTTQVGIPFWLL